ncbi:ankyrin repeat domain-containing protein [Deltaproteobacteria bacterium OttesenSCG-928-K17]|nr:ankyrin repeat domain-containing protein [Deltaproteobacteria bacterium OttesenSCG-928-K17]
MKKHLAIAALILFCLPGQVQAQTRPQAQGNAAGLSADEIFVHACCNGTPDLIRRAIAAGAKVNVMPEGGPSPLAAALMCPGDKKGKVKTLLAAKADPNFLPGDLSELAIAVGLGDLEIITDLFEAGAVVKKNHARPILVEAATVSFLWQPEDHAQLLALLIKHGADVKAGRPDGTTPILAAAHHGGPQALKTLLEAGAKGQINQPNQYGMTPLMIAARNNPNLESITVLLEHGADPRQKDQAGLSAADQAERNTSPAAPEIKKAIEAAAEKVKAVRELSSSFPAETPEPPLNCGGKWPLRGSE